MKLYHILLSGFLVALCIAAPVAADDPIAGDWDISGSMPFLFFSIPCASGDVTFNADGTGVATGTADLLFFNIYSMNNERFTWEKIGTNLYQVTFPYAVVNLNYDSTADKLTTKLNPATFGAPFSLDIDGTATRA